MAIRLKTPATALAVSVADMKTHLRVSHSSEDALIQTLILAAQGAAESMIQRAIMPQTWEVTLDAFPDGAIELTRVPAASVTFLKYIDTNGVLQTFTNYVLDAWDGDGSAWLLPLLNYEWPNTSTEANAVRVEYVAGWATAADVPEDIKVWLRLAVGAMFENRELANTSQTFTLGFADTLLQRHRVFQ